MINNKVECVVNRKTYTVETINDYEYDFYTIKINGVHYKKQLKQREVN